MRINEIAMVRVWYGHKRIHIPSRGEGWLVNHEWIHRIYREERLNLRVKRMKRRVGAAHRVEMPPAAAVNDSWSMDFITESLFKGGGGSGR